MARFFVGQRVKLIAGVDAGNTGVFLGMSWDDDDLCEWADVRFDNAGPTEEGEISAPGEICSCDPDDLAPILPAHEPVTIAALLEEFPSLSVALGGSDYVYGPYDESKYD